MITVYSICYNEEVLLPHFFNHYKGLFGEKVKFVVYDNYSTDKSVDICIQNGANVIQYDTNNTLSDAKYLEIKNNCWKNSDTDWNLICDCDEFLQISWEDIEKEDSTIIRSEGYNMINMSENPSSIEIENLTFGSRASQYDKYYLFNKKFITEINYGAGCHNANPKGLIKFSKKTYPLYHYKAIGEDYLVNRYKMFAERMSENNKKMGWGIHYLNSEEILRRDYKNAQKHEIIKIK